MEKREGFGTHQGIFVTISESFGTPPVENSNRNKWKNVGRRKTARIIWKTSENDHVE